MGVSAAIAVVGAVTTHIQDQGQKRAAFQGRQAVNRQNDQIEQASAESAAAEEKSLALKANAAQKNRQRAIRAQQGGRAGTILTDPTGAIGGGTGSVNYASVGSSGSKTLLGT